MTSIINIDWSRLLCIYSVLFVKQEKRLFEIYYELSLNWSSISKNMSTHNQLHYNSSCKFLGNILVSWVNTSVIFKKRIGWQFVINNTWNDLASIHLIIIKSSIAVYKGNFITKRNLFVSHAVTQVFALFLNKKKWFEYFI